MSCPRKKKKQRKVKRLQRKASAWALREYLKLPYARLPDALLAQIAMSRRQTIQRVKYEPDRIVIWLG
ncbi:MAG: hypothetical protein NTW29_15585 [Bacteroidetes bacterium]|nr:hypothetical protein [Bacteroidota bacterium]